jgi:integrase/recombinase XerD
LYATLAHLTRFFQWLAGQPGYKSRFQYSDADYFNLSEKETRIATARRERPSPTLAQVKHVIDRMPASTEIEMRNRALVAFTVLTGARDSAIASLKLKHVNLAEGSVYQDAREVKTKASKTFTTYFFQVGDDVVEIFTDWVMYLLTVKLWGNDDPLFPATEIRQGANRQFAPSGLKRAHWSSAGPIREIFREAFTGAGLQYFNPHSLRKTLASLGGTLCRTAEEYKAWSQNLGHAGVLTTFLSYGEVQSSRQGEIIANLSQPKSSGQRQFTALATAVARESRELDGTS